MKGTIDEEINNLLDNMFSNEDIHTEIRCNQITTDMAYRLGKAKTNYNHLKVVVLCKLSDNVFILKIKGNYPGISLLMKIIWWRYSKEDTHFGQS